MDPNGGKSGGAALQGIGIGAVFTVGEEEVNLLKEFCEPAWVRLDNGHLAQFTPPLLFGFRHT